MEVVAAVEVVLVFVNKLVNKIWCWGDSDKYMGTSSRLLHNTEPSRMIFFSLTVRLRDLQHQFVFFGREVN